MSKALAAIRTTVGDELSPEVIAQATANQDLIKGRIFEANWESDEGPEIPPPLPGELRSALGERFILIHDEFIPGRDQRLTIAQADWLVNAITWPLIYAHGVVLPDLLELTANSPAN